MFEAPSVMEAEGDWEDLAASVQVGAEQSEMAIVRQPKHVADSPARFELVTNLNEPVVLKAERAGESAKKITLTAAVGRFGDQGRERALLRRIARRLGDLYGVEFAPVRED